MKLSPTACCSRARQALPSQRVRREPKTRPLHRRPCTRSFPSSRSTAKTSTRHFADLGKARSAVQPRLHAPERLLPRHVPVEHQVAQGRGGRRRLFHRRQCRVGPLRRLSLRGGEGRDPRLGYLRYEYPSSSDFNPKPNTDEVYIGASYGLFSAKYSYSINDTFGKRNSKGSDYLEFDYNQPLTSISDKLTLNGVVGHQTYAHNGFFSYTVWKLGATWDFGNGATAGAYSRAPMRRPTRTRSRARIGARTAWWHSSPIRSDGLDGLFMRQGAVSTTSLSTRRVYCVHAR